MDAKVITSELISAATSRLEGYKKLLSLAETQRDILLNGRHEELFENASEQDSVIAEISRVEKREESLMQRLESGAETLQDPEFEFKLSNILGQLQEIALKLHPVVSANKEMLANAKEYVNFTIGVVSKLAMEQQAQNCEGAASSSIMLDAKV